MASTARSPAPERARSRAVGRVTLAGPILDVGSGGGTVTALAAERVGALGGVALDWSARAVREAAGRGLAAVRASVDGANLPFAPASFDVVLLSEVIEH